MAEVAVDRPEQDNGDEKGVLDFLANYMINENFVNRPSRFDQPLSNRNIQPNNTDLLNELFKPVPNTPLLSSPFYGYETSSVHSSYTNFHSLSNANVDFNDYSDVMGLKFNLSYYTKVYLGTNAHSSNYSSEIKGYTFDRYVESLGHCAFYGDSDKCIPEDENGDLIYTPKNNGEIMYPGVRYIADNIIVFEMPPTQKHFSYIEAMREHRITPDAKEHYLPVPWQVYVAVFDQNTMRVSHVAMYFSDSPLSSFGQQLYLPPLLNFYSNGNLCRPTFATMEDYEKYPNTINGVIASSYDWVWNSGFNFDITETMSEFIVSNRWLKLKEFSTLSESNKKSVCDTLSSVRYSSNSLNTGAVSALLTLWESVPITNILQCQWISFSKEEAFFSHSIRSYIEHNFDTVSDWVMTNYKLELIGDFESEEDSEDYNTDTQITVSGICENSNYYRHAIDLLRSRKTTLFDAYLISSKFVNQYKSRSTSHDKFNEFLHEHSNYMTQLVFS